MEWPEPKNLKQTQAFLGFTNFYQRFVRGYSEVARPLTRLTGKEGFSWGPEQKSAFQKLKDRIAEDAVLALPTDDGKFRVEADASEGATGAVLSQEQEGEWRPVAFMSHGLNETERNYKIYDKEMLAIMLALEEWRSLLMGAKHTFEILTDHQNLQYFKTPQKVNRRQARWITELSEFDFVLSHRAGALNKKADLLSRRADHDQGKGDNENVVLLKPEYFRSQEIVIEGPEAEIMSQIKADKKVDKSVKLALEKKLPGWEKKEDVIYYNGLIYVPRNEELRDRIIGLHHDSPLLGHPGENRTQEMIERNYWWPRLGNRVAKYIKECEACQRTRVHRYKQGKLNPHKITEGPWQIISMDLIGPLPVSNGFNAIQVWVDTFTKQLHAEPTNMELASEGVARLTRDRVIRYHGVPHKIISDRDPRYVSGFMRELNRLLGVEMNLSTAFHPITDGQTERMNQEIEKYLRIYVNYRQSDWAEWLALAEFAHNDKASSSTTMSPFYANMGYHPWKGIENAVESRNKAANNFGEKMKKIRDEAAAALEKAQKTMKKHYDAHRRDAPEFKVGDKVWLEGKDIATDRPTKKFDDTRLGPYEILEKVGASAYKLRLPETDQSHPVFNEAKLTPYVEPPAHRREKRLVPQIISGYKEYEVEEILKHRKRGRGFQYLIKWKNYPLGERTWEPRRHLTHMKKLLDRYNAEHNIKIRSLPVLPKGYWDYLIHRYKTKEESQQYSTKKLFIPETGTFVTVGEDADPRGGVMSRFDANLIMTTPILTPSNSHGQ